MADPAKKPAKNTTNESPVNRRLYVYAIVMLALTVAAVAALPWISVRSGFGGVSWNGFGSQNISGSAEDTLDASPGGPGWLLLVTAIVAFLAAVSYLVPATRGYTRSLLWVAAICALGTTAVPIAVLVSPDWYTGDLLDQFGGGMLNARDYLYTPVVVVEVLLLLGLAALCWFAATTLSDDDPSEDSSPADDRVSPADD